jgi:hypothetical protein
MVNGAEAKKLKPEADAGGFLKATAELKAARSLLQ